ncbi:MAG TPA: FkbM family methyltransferase, partial [Pirellulaceae bacterium]|nr:FkbM family methyltransferase [Pirellulaceae bacterium]
IWAVKMPELSRHSVPAEADEYPYCPCDEVVVSSVEINSRHGTGLLIQYLVEDFSRVATVNSKRVYNGERVRSAAHFFLPDPDAPRHEIYHIVHHWFRKSPPQRAYVVPFFESDLLIGMALKDLFRTRIGLHIMDDNCLYGGPIPSGTCEEAIDKADLVFAISPEMRQAYEQRFGKKVLMLPPIVPAELIASELVTPVAPPAPARGPARWWQAIRRLWTGRRASTHDQSQRGILVGNIWDRSWLQLLRDTIRESGLQIDWFSNNPEAVWLKGSTQDLAKDGIHLQPALWGEELVAELRKRPFAIMPTGRLGHDEQRESIARLSLPSRVPFAVASSHLPIVVIGSEDTSAAGFVHRFQIGATVPYDGQALRSAVEQVVQPQIQQEMRARARQIAPQFSAAGVGAWLWKSLDQGRLIDQRFEDLFPVQSGDFQWYFDASPPRGINWSFRSTWQMLNRLRGQGLAPQIIVDVGASTGIWSWTASQVFPEARFILVDPLFSVYGADRSNFYLQQLSNHQVVESALSDHSGETEILMSDDLYGSSLLKVDQKMRQCQRRKVQLMTLDQLAQQCQLSGPTLLKIDVQFAEHLVLMGGRQFLRDHVEAMIMELTLEREHPQAKTYREMLDLAEELGFGLVDETEGWRNPQNGRLEQKDSVFFRRDRLALQRAA